MAFKVTSLKDLPIFQSGGTDWIVLEKLHKVLNDNKLEDEPRIHSANLFKWLKRKDNGVRKISDKPAFSVKSVIHFFFAHADTNQFCKKVTTEITNKISGPAQLNTESDKFTSVKALYDVVAQSECFEKCLLSQVELKNEDIPSLYKGYRTDFTDRKWEKICFFEYHYSRSQKSDVTSDTYQQMLLKKASYYEQITMMNKCGNDVFKDSLEETIRRIKRKELHEKDEAIQVTARYVHSPSVLEIDIINHLQSLNTPCSIFCIDCTRRCTHDTSLHLYVEVNSDNEIDVSYAEIATIISSHIEQRHNDTCSQITFFKEGTLNRYTDEKGEKLRFKLRDDVILKKLKENTCYEWENTESFDVRTSDSSEKCPLCYITSDLKPLSMKSFNIMQEWYLETPLTSQILFEKFINRNSLSKSTGKDNFLIKKYMKLYSQYDSLLNTANKNYIGVIQDLNTQELTMNYQSISSVFNVTSSYGLTQSLQSAEIKMKEKSHCEKTYYNTFLKKCPITYDSVAGVKTDMVSLRECFLILMMDNLVRLKKHADPDPGDCRSMQMCTLPITLRGMPSDSAIVELWHNKDCSQEIAACDCKKDRQLSKDAINLYLKVTDNEQHSLDKVQRLTCFAHKAIWEQVFEDGIHLIDNDCSSKNLDMSLASLHLDGDDEEEACDDSQLNATIMSVEEFSEIVEGATLEQIEPEEVHDLSALNLENISIQHNDSISEDNVSLDNSIVFIENSDADDAELTVETHIQTEDHNEKADNFLDIYLKYLEFEQFTSPTLLTKHPPPAIGRDDDIRKLKDVLDDILVKTDNTSESSHKILFAPDHKISSNLLKLRDINHLYKIFLPEFPCLHLRKSKITILCSAYKDAGILHILKYMRDEDFQEWKKLISADHIEMATTYIRRLAIAFHVAFFIKFIQTLSEDKRKAVQQSILNATDADAHWTEFETFMSKGRSVNGTFALHEDIMNHCDEITTISLAERLGGEIGYTLLLASVKRSLPFSFLNGALAYASFTTRLLHEYYVCGDYYRNMKHTLFSTSIDGSTVNFALDTQREIDHKDALKAFRSGSTVTSILPRMSLIDTLNEVHDLSKKGDNLSKAKSKSIADRLGLKTTSTDKVYVIRLVSLILRQGGISLAQDSNVYNVYDARKPVLSSSILDKETVDIGQYLIKKFVSQARLFGCNQSDGPNIEDVKGPTDLLQKLKTSKGTTMKRTSVKLPDINKSERQVKEEKRQKEVKRQTKTINCLSSEMNACQALVKPDCSKPKVQKSSGVKQALITSLLLTKGLTGKQNKDAGERLLEEDNLIHSNKKSFPKVVSETATYATVEFAGVKFKTQSASGAQYLKYVENSVIMKTKIQLPKLQQIAICEEKYSFTPDDFKAATRTQRQQKKAVDITHLKTADEMLTMDKFDRKTIISTSEGKSLISTYLVRNATKLNIQTEITVDIDSEYVMSKCHCGQNMCECQRYTNPLRIKYLPDFKPVTTVLHTIKQNKGEAEMAQVDWLAEYAPNLQSGESVISIVTSGDIDAVVIHMFSLAHMWQRTESGFAFDVYVALQKPGGTYDIYNVTNILLMLENYWKDAYVGMKIALVLSLGGNDFLPKFHGISHTKTVDTFFQSPKLLSGLFVVASNNDTDFKIEFSVECYKELLKTLYCSKKTNPTLFSFEEIRQMTIIPPRSRKLDDFRNPQTWMPPETVIEQLSKNICCLIRYYLTAGRHFAQSPDFLKDGCLRRMQDGSIEYDLGPDVFLKNVAESLVADPQALERFYCTSQLIKLLY